MLPFISDVALECKIFILMKAEGAAGMSGSQGTVRLNECFDRLVGG